MNHINDLKIGAQELFADLKEKKIPTEPKHVRLINILFFGLVGVVLIIYPALFRMTYAGYISDDATTRIVNEFLRLYGALALALAFINLLNKPDNTELATVMTYLAGGMALLRAFFVYAGGSMVYVIDLLFFGFLAFLNGKAAKLF